MAPCCDAARATGRAGRLAGVDMPAVRTGQLLLGQPHAGAAAAAAHVPAQRHPGAVAWGWPCRHGGAARERTGRQRPALEAGWSQRARPCQDECVPFLKTECFAWRR